MQDLETLAVLDWLLDLRPVLNMIVELGTGSRLRNRSGGISGFVVF